MDKLFVTINKFFPTGPSKQPTLRYIASKRVSKETRPQASYSLQFTITTLMALMGVKNSITSRAISSP